MKKTKSPVKAVFVASNEMPPNAKPQGRERPLQALVRRFCLGWVLLVVFCLFFGTIYGMVVVLPWQGWAVLAGIVLTWAAIAHCGVDWW